MKKYTMGMIGCGNMGGALVRAAAKTLTAGSIAISDHHEDRLEPLAKDAGADFLSAMDIAASSVFVVLGVKPRGICDTVGEIAEALSANADAVLVSMAAGVEIKTLRAYAKQDIPVIRIMPNTPVAVGAGIILYALSDNVTAEREAEFLEMFSAAGRLIRIEEREMDAATAVAGCGPAFAYLFAEALADGGVECGIPRERAALYAAEMLRGAAEMLIAYGHPADLKDAVCSPGGSTIAGVHALERGGFRASVMDAVTAAYDKTCQMK